MNSKQRRKEYRLGNNSKPYRWKGDFISTDYSKNKIICPQCGYKSARETNIGGQCTKCKIWFNQNVEQAMKSKDPIVIL